MSPCLIPTQTYLRFPQYKPAYYLAYFSLSVRSTIYLCLSLVSLTWCRHLCTHPMYYFSSSHFPCYLPMTVTVRCPHCTAPFHCYQFVFIYPSCYSVPYIIISLSALGHIRCCHVCFKYRIVCTMYISHMICPTDLKFHPIVASPTHTQLPDSAVIDCIIKNSHKVPKVMYGTILIFFLNFSFTSYVRNNK